MEQTLNSSLSQEQLQGCQADLTALKAKVQALEKGSGQLCCQTLIEYKALQGLYNVFLSCFWRVLTAFERILTYFGGFFFFVFFAKLMSFWETKGFGSARVKMQL